MLIYGIIITLAQFALSIPQTEFLPTLLKTLYINNCIIIKPEINVTNLEVSFTKYLSNYNIQTAYVTFDEMNATMYQYHRLEIHKRRVFVIIDVKIINDDLVKIFSYNNEDLLQDYAWAIFDLDEIILENLEYVYIPYNSQFLNIKTVNDNVYEIFEIYHPLVVPREIFKVFFGVWKGVEGLEVSNRDFYERRFDMNRTILPARTDYMPGPCKHPALCAYAEIVRDMGRMMNFRPFFMSDETYDQIWENNTNYPWEFSLGLYVFHASTYSRNMIAPIWKTPAFLHIAYNKKYEQGYSSPHTKPINSNVWIIIIIWISISGPCLFLMNYLPRKKVIKHSLALINFVFLPMDSFTNQCGSKLPKSISTRIAAIMTRLAPFFIIPIYSAAVLSFVTVKLIDLPFKDLRGLVEDGSFKIGYENGTFLHYFFRGSTDRLTLLALDKYMVNLDKMPRSPHEGIEKLCKDSKFAFLFFNNDIYNKIYQIEGQCHILQIPTPVLLTYDGFTIRYESPYKKIFNRILKSFFSAGVLQKMKKEVYGSKPVVKKEDRPDPVRLESVTHLFDLMTIFYFMSVLILCIECVCYRRKKLQRDKEPKFFLK